MPPLLLDEDRGRGKFDSPSACARPTARSVSGIEETRCCARWFKLEQVLIALRRPRAGEIATRTRRSKRIRPAADSRSSRP